MWLRNRENGRNGTDIELTDDVSIPGGLFSAVTTAISCLRRLVYTARSWRGPRSTGRKKKKRWAWETSQAFFPPPPPLQYSLTDWPRVWYEVESQIENERMAVIGGHPEKQRAHTSLSRLELMIYCPIWREVDKITKSTLPAHRFLWTAHPLNKKKKKERKRRKKKEKTSPSWTIHWSERVVDQWLAEGNPETSPASVPLVSIFLGLAELR